MHSKGTSIAANLCINNKSYGKESYPPKPIWPKEFGTPGGCARLCCRGLKNWTFFWNKANIGGFIWVPFSDPQKKPSDFDFGHCSSGGGATYSDFFSQKIGEGRPLIEGSDDVAPTLNCTVFLWSYSKIVFFCEIYQNNFYRPLILWENASKETFDCPILKLTPVFCVSLLAVKKIFCSKAKHHALSK